SDIIYLNMTSHRCIPKLWKGGYCMSKLSPKPTRRTKFKTWKDLDRTLKNSFGECNFDSATIILDEYEISKEEIILEATQQGYKVIDNNDNYLTFE
ncbi:TPA: hypothetical protein ACQNGH_001672, partial [Streptococcus pyogenes]